MNSKHWYQSRTVWVNIATAAVTAVAAIAQYIYGKPLIDPGVQGVIVGVVVSGINLFMRKITGQPIT